MMSCRLRNCRNRKKNISGKLKLSGAQGRKCKAKEEEEEKVAQNYGCFHYREQKKRPVWKRR